MISPEYVYPKAMIPHYHLWNCISFDFVMTGECYGGWKMGLMFEI